MWWERSFYCPIKHTPISNDVVDLTNRVVLLKKKSRLQSKEINNNDIEIEVREFFAEGKNIEEIAKIKECEEEIIETYVAEIICKGYIIDIKRLNLTKFQYLSIINIIEKDLGNNISN